MEEHKLPEEVSLDIFQVDKKYARKLPKIVEELEQEARYTAGVAVREIEDKPGLYEVQIHDGEITHKRCLVRVVEDQIWIKDLSWRIEGCLRRKRIPYMMGRVNINRKFAQGTTALPVSLEGLVEVTYTPKKPTK